MDLEKFILDLAKSSINNFLTGKEALVKNIPDPLKIKGKTFVTLYNKGELRGCIGSLESKDPLYLDIIKNSIKAASEDSRFNPIDLSELDDLEIIVTVLLDIKPLDYSSPQDLLSKLDPGKDGVILSIGNNSATYLPDVWNDIPNKIEFLTSLSEKAGLESDDWKTASIKTFKTLVIEEIPKLYAIHNKGFYPPNKKILDKFFSKNLNNKDTQPVKAMIVPHAGLKYSGKIASLAYNKINPDKYNKVIILGPSHQPMSQPMASPGVDIIVTPLGNIPIENIKPINFDAHDQEHSVKMQLIFVQKLFSKAKIFPILVSHNADYKKIAKNLSKFIDNKTLLIVSSDLSHYKSSDQARNIDKNTINNILKLAPESNIDACGDAAIRILLQLAKELKLDPKLIGYTNSGNISGDLSNVVGYASILFLK